MSPVIARPLSTRRLSLVPLSVDDICDLYEISKNPASIEDFYPAATKPVDTEKFVQETLDCKDPSWTIRLDGEIIGFITLEHDGPSAEAGYFLDVLQAGNGYTTEALTAAIHWAFTEGGYGRVQAGVTNGNIASSRVVEKAGLAHYKTKLQDWEWKGETFDSHYYEILKAN
jgi:ribosomal-protein-alanine N-acetyltransferase